MMLAKAKELFVKYRRFIVYSLAGIINTTVDFSVFTLILSLGVNIAVAQAVAYTSGLVSSYILNKKFTFKNNTTSMRQILLFLVVNGVTLIISVAVVYFFSKLLGFQKFIVKVFLVTPIVMVLNYSGLRYVVFAEPK